MAQCMIAAEQEKESLDASVERVRKRLKYSSCSNMGRYSIKSTSYSQTRIN